MCGLFFTVTALPACATMSTMLPLVPYIIVLLAALGGFGLTIYIRTKKMRKEAFVCPIGFDCDVVMQSSYGRFFGIPVEFIGMAYYGFLLVLYTLFATTDLSSSAVLSYGALTATLIAFLFSLYLTFIQAFTLKQWCSWCLTSAGLCTLIFFTVLFSADFAFDFLQDYRRALLGVHLLGLALGLGGATATDFFFFRFLRDLRISKTESSNLQALSQVIWFGLVLLIVSGLALFFADPVRLAASSKFLVKVVAVAVIVVNGAFLNLSITPKLIHISFGDPHKHQQGELRHDRRLAFALGGISLSSWYTAFVLGLMRQVPLSLGALLLIYLAVLVVAITVSQFLESFVARLGWQQGETNLDKRA